MEAFVSVVQHVAERWQEALLFLIITCSVATFVTGGLKLFILNKAKENHKRLRKVACFLTGLALTCGVAAIYFAIGKFDFHYYLFAICFAMPTEVVLYALYENTLVRDAVDFVARKFLTAVIPVAAAAIYNGENNDTTKMKLAEAATKVKKETAKKVSDDLDKL